MKSRAQYCCATWAAWEPRGNQVILQRLQAVSNKLFRVIYGLERMDSVRSILKNHNILNIRQLYDFNVGQIMYKGKNNELPDPLKNLFETDPDLYNYFFRTQRNRLKQTEKSICVAGPRIWNSLPNSCIQEPNFKAFKVKLRGCILDKIT